MELEPTSLTKSTLTEDNYIIPIWNWSSNIEQSIYRTSSKITLFLYGIGACLFLLRLLYIYIITLFLYGIGAFIPDETLLESLQITLFLYGIGANIACSLFSFLYSLHYSYMELELSIMLYSLLILISITLFLYGIGATDIYIILFGF